MRPLAHADRRRLKRHLLKIQGQADTDCLLRNAAKHLGPITNAEIPARLLAAARGRRVPFKVVVRLYALAIVVHGQNGQVSWRDVGEAVQKRFWYVLSAVDVLKRRAWREIRRARKPQRGQTLRRRLPEYIQAAHEADGVQGEFRGSERVSLVLTAILAVVGLALVIWVVVEVLSLVLT